MVSVADAGRREGLLAFKKTGREIHIIPYASGVDGVAAEPVPTDAPDLSDFIAGLGPTKG